MFADLAVGDIPTFVQQFQRDKEQDQSVNELASLRTEEIGDEELNDDDDHNDDEDSISMEESSVDYQPEDSIRFADIDEFVENIPSGAIDPLERLIIEEATTEVKNALSRELWRIVRQRYVENRTVNEIAREEGITATDVQRQLAKAKEILNKRMLNI